MSPALHLVALWRCRAAPETRETLMKNTQLLLVNDMCGYGKVALSAMLPVLSHMGYRIHNLPTALVMTTDLAPSSRTASTRARASSGVICSAIGVSVSRQASV